MFRRLALSLLAVASAGVVTAGGWFALPARSAPFSPARPEVVASGSLPGAIAVANRGAGPARVLVRLRSRQVDLGVLAPGQTRRLSLPRARSARVLALAA